MLVSVVIPAHNEEGRLATTLQLYYEALQQQYGHQFEIIVVANGCSDNTTGVAARAAETMPRIKIVDVQAAVGKGGAVLEGFRHALGEWIAFVDADGATAPESLMELLEQLDQADVVIGSRRLSTSQVVQAQPLQRQMLGRVFATSVWLLFRLPFRDTQCGAKAFRRDAAKQLAQLVHEKHWAFDVDLLLCGLALDYRIVEHPVVWADQAGSKLRVGATGQQVLQAMWRMKRRKLSAPVPAYSTLFNEA